jgi:hypothetical protein
MFAPSLCGTLYDINPYTVTMQTKNAIVLPLAPQREWAAPAIVTMAIATADQGAGVRASDRKYNVVSIEIALSRNPSAGKRKGSRRGRFEAHRTQYVSVSNSIANRTAASP